MRFEVPQFIEIEDKIFGPFTWKQFVYLLGGAGAIFMLFVWLPFIIFVVAAAPIVALTAGLAFYKVNNRPFAAILESFVTYFMNARLYLWKKQEQKVVPTGGGAPQTYLPPSKTTLSTLSRQLELNALRGKK